MPEKETLETRRERQARAMSLSCRRRGHMILSTIR